MITVIGDVHGKLRDYSEIVNGLQHTVQIGDMGFDYEPLNKLDPDRHVFFGGNHDNYDIIDKSPNSMGDFGSYTLNGVGFFFLRGERSVDKAYRREGLDWWREEELEYTVLERAIKMYEVLKPRIVLSHGCPTKIIDLVTKDRPHFGRFRPSSTAQAMQTMWEIHRPELWIFGHHHRDFMTKMQPTLFVCLDELKSMDVSIDGNGEIFIDNFNINDI